MEKVAVFVDNVKQRRALGHLVWISPTNHFSNGLKSFANLPTRLLKETFLA